MAFRILKKIKDGGSSLNSVYKFIPTIIDGDAYFLEFNTKEEVDKYVEEQLNMGVPKTDLEVVASMKYTVSASIEDEDCGCSVPTTNPSVTTPSMSTSESASASVSSSVSTSVSASTGTSTSGSTTPTV